MLGNSYFIRLNMLVLMSAVQCMCAYLFVKMHVNRYDCPPDAGKAVSYVPEGFTLISALLATHS